MKLKQFLIISVCVSLIGILGGCGQPAQDNPSEEADKQMAKEHIIDQNDREVILPEQMEKVVMTALPLPSIYALTGAPIDKIVGMHPGAKSAIANSIMGKMTPELLNAETGFIEGTDLNIEEVLKLQPDIAFFWGAYTNQQEQWEEAGIPAIAVKTQGGGDALETLSSWLKIFGTVFDKESQVNDVIAYGETTLDEIRNKTNALKEEEKVQSLILFKHSTEEIIVPGQGHYGQFWIEATGGYNVARDIDVTANVNMEQIYAWNPEVLFISSFTETMPQDLYENNISGQDWSKVEAVKNKRVYKIPVGVYRWYPPSGDVPLMMKWIAKSQYPEIFSDINMEAEIVIYYDRFYNYAISTDEVNHILNPVKDAASGTGGLSKQ